MKLGTELAEITAGVDALYRNTPREDGFLNREGLIPVAVAEVTTREFTSYAAALEALDALQARLGEADSAMRRDYLSEMITSLKTLVRGFNGEKISFAERLKGQLRVDTTLVGEDVLDGYRATIRETLDELGYHDGEIASDLARWEEDVRIPADKVIAVLEELQVEARTRVAKTMYDFADEWMMGKGVSEVPFSAYCDYPGRQLLLNLDFPYNWYSLKHLATHEAFPGHLVHLGLRERYVGAGKMPLDGAQVVTSSASSPLFEGIADNGMFFVDWVDTPADKLAVAVQRLHSALRCNAAWMMHAQGKTLDEIVPVIAKAGYQEEELVRGRLAFLSHDLRAPFVYAYWCGDMAVNEVWNTVPTDRREEFWAYLYGNMHTPTTLKTYWS